MPLPLFFAPAIQAQDKLITLEEDTSRHVAQVLRMKEGERLELTDGQGNLLTTEIVSEHKKKTQVRVLSAVHQPFPHPRTAIAISLVKNTSRFEWFLEKATEIGVSEIIPLLCDRTEKQHFRLDRMRSILVSAMLQSQQVWLPLIGEPRKFQDVIVQYEAGQKFIAHCLEAGKDPLKDRTHQHSHSIILIGPEGDFTKEEIDLALQQGYQPVSLGNTRLRTETAGMVAAVLLTLD